MAPTRKTHFHTIKPNTNAVLSMLRDSLQPKEATAAGFKAVHIGSNMLPVSILEMTPLNGKTWQKTSSFDSLATTLRSHIDNLSIPDLPNVVSTEVPLDTTTSYVAAEVVKKQILASFLDVFNLTGVSFLNGTGGLAKTLATTANTDRIKDILYIRLSYSIDAKHVDKKIEQEPLYVSFCLNLPQSS